MTAPTEDACWSQILVELRELRIQVAVLTEQLKSVPDHEDRLRALERRVWAIPSVATVIAVAALVKDWIP